MSDPAILAEVPLSSATGAEDALPLQGLGTRLLDGGELIQRQQLQVDRR